MSRSQEHQRPSLSGAVSQMQLDDLHYVGIALVSNKKLISKIVANLGLFK